MDRQLSDRDQCEPATINNVFQCFGAIERASAIAELAIGLWRSRADCETAKFDQSINELTN